MGEHESLVDGWIILGRLVHPRACKRSDRKETEEIRVQTPWCRVVIAVIQPRRAVQTREEHDQHGQTRERPCKGMEV